LLGWTFERGAGSDPRDRLVEGRSTVLRLPADGLPEERGFPTEGRSDWRSRGLRTPELLPGVGRSFWT